MKYEHLLAGNKRFNYFKGAIVSKPQGGWNYILEAASFWSAPNEPNNDVLLTSLKHIKSMVKIEDKSYFDFINVPVVAMLNSWEFGLHHILGLMYLYPVL